MVGEISNWPHGRSARDVDWRISAAMLVAIIAAVASITLVPEHEDLKLLPQVAGCYLNRSHRIAIIVDSRKVLRADALTVPVAIYDQKWGGARLYPDRRVIYAAGVNRIEATGGEPYFIDSDRFFTTLSVIGDDDSPSVEFSRVPCPHSSNTPTR